MAKEKENIEKEYIDIKHQSKFNKLSSDIQIRDIGSQLAKLLYGDEKSMTSGKNGILGKSQSILIQQHDLKTKYIYVHIPNGCENTEMYTKVINMIHHAKNHNLDISIK